MEFEIPSVISIRGERLVYRKAFEEFDCFKKKSLLQVANEKNLLNNFPSGHMNKKIRLQMNRILSNWISSVEFIKKTEITSKKRLFTFVTLTLPADQFHTDKELHRLALNRFLIHAKRRFKIVNYLWRAERQKNGNLHYHLIFDNYVHWRVIRLSWNAIMNDLGYIERYRINQKIKHKNGFFFDKSLEKFWSKERQFTAYQEGIANDWSNPNSTDIHSLKNVKNVTNYVLKYVSKSDEVDDLKILEGKFLNKIITESEYETEKILLQVLLDKEKINGRVWGCSDEIKNLKDAKIFEDLEVVQLLEVLKNDKNTKNIDFENTVIIYNKNMLQHWQKFKSISSQINEHHRINYLTAYGLDYRKFVKKEYPKSEIIINTDAWKPIKIVKDIQLQMFN